MHVCMCVLAHICMYVCHSIYRGQRTTFRSSSVLLQCGSPGSNSDPRAWWQVLYPLRYIAGYTGLSISYMLSYSRFTSGQSEALDAEEIT